MSPTIKNLLKLEEVFEMLLAVALFSFTDFNWFVFFILFLTPDISMIGYLINPKIGAFTYNLIHTKAIAYILILLALGIENSEYYNLLLAVGSILLAHICFDRSIGYGLKLTDSFKNTHLGKL